MSTRDEELKLACLQQAGGDLLRAMEIYDWVANDHGLMMVGQAYQVVGLLISTDELPAYKVSDAEAIRALDYFAAGKYDPDFLPWPRTEGMTNGGDADHPPQTGIAKTPIAEPPAPTTVSDSGEGESGLDASAKSLRDDLKDDWLDGWYDADRCMAELASGEPGGGVNIDPDPTDKPLIVDDTPTIPRSEIPQGAAVETFTDAGVETVKLSGITHIVDDAPERVAETQPEAAYAPIHNEDEPATSEQLEAEGITEPGASEMAAMRMAPGTQDKKFDPFKLFRTREPA